MDFALGPEDEAFRDELRAWLDEHLPPFLEKEALDEEAKLSGGAATSSDGPPGSASSTRAAGRPSTGPPSTAGRAATAMQRVIASEVMAEYRTPGMFNTNGVWQIGPMIITWGTDEQKARWLPSILEAHDHWCQGFPSPRPATTWPTCGRRPSWTVTTTS